MTDRKFAPPVYQPTGRSAGLPVSLEEPYRVIQAEESALVGTTWAGGRMLRFFSQHMAVLSAAALLLGGLVGLALLWTFSFWVR